VLNRTLAMLGLSDHMLLVNLNNIFLSVKQNLSYVWSLRPHVLNKLILHVIFSKYQIEPWLCLAPQTTCLR